VRFLIVASVLTAALLSQRPSGDARLGARLSFITLQVSNVKFDGQPSDRTDPPGPGDDSQGLDGQGPVDTGKTIFFRAHFLGWSSDGLAAWHAETRTWRTYPMSALAEAARWYGVERQTERVDNDIHGLAGTADRIWMGTSGLGIVMLDVRTTQWSRYDVQARPEPGRNNRVHYADDDYVFAWGGGRSTSKPTGNPELSYPGLEVHSVKRNAWVRIDAVPRANVISLATNSGIAGVAMSCSQVPYDTEPYVPLSECGASYPDRVTRIQNGDAYELERLFPSPGVSARYILTRQQLETAIRWFGR
jgi:hypothetical protein